MRKLPEPLAQIPTALISVKSPPLCQPTRTASWEVLYVEKVMLRTKKFRLDC